MWSSDRDGRRFIFGTLGLGQVEQKRFSLSGKEKALKALFKMAQASRWPNF